jgi:hypothetical protein
MYGKSLQETFLRRVLIGDGCWEMPRRKGTIRRPGPYSGYVTLYDDRKGGNYHISAHRYSYELFVGQIPEGLFICHRCDNPGCMKPSHLFPGTPADNMRDASRKYRIGHQKISHVEVLQGDNI